MITRRLTPHERISLITEIFSDHNQVTIVGHLAGDDAQTFIDMVDEVSFCALTSTQGQLPLKFPPHQALDALKPLTRMECLRYLPKICGNQGLIPRSLAIPLCYDPTGCPLYQGAFADVWKGHHRGREVAAKVLRLSPKNDCKPITKVGFFFFGFVVCADSQWRISVGML